MGGGFEQELLFDLPEDTDSSGSTVVWNPWHGCKRYSEGCRNCYVYRIDGMHGKDASKISKTKSYSLPMQKTRGGKYRIPYGSLVYLCFSSDFFLEQADPWRPGIWEMIRIRRDLRFFLITKRITRAAGLLPSYWDEIKSRIEICCTMEDQNAVNARFSAYSEFPAHSRTIVCEPLIGKINFSTLDGISKVIVGGESGPEARVCSYSWVMDIRRQCQEAGIAFYFKQTGARFEKDGKVYNIPRSIQHEQARKAGIDIGFAVGNEE